MNEKGVVRYRCGIGCQKEMTGESSVDPVSLFLVLHEQEVSTPTQNSKGRC